MATNAEIDAEIARRKKAKEIDAEIERRLNLTPPPGELSFGEKLKGTLEGLGTMVSAAAIEPVAGWAGLLGTAAETVGVAPEGYGAQQVRDMRETFTYKPDSREGKDALAGLGDDMSFLTDKIQTGKEWLGDSTMEKTGSPALAGLATVIPDAMMLAPMIPRTPKIPKYKSKHPTLSPEAQQQQIAETLAKGKPAEISKLVDADPAFFKAANDIGVTAEPLASFGSKNQQFVAVEQGLASVPSSVLDVKSKAFITDLSGRADAIIEKFGGTLDKGQLNIDFKRTALETIEGLSKSADEVYSSLSKTLPKTGRYEAANTVAFLQEKVREFGGVEQLPPKLKSMYKALVSKTSTKKGTTNLITGKPNTTDTTVIHPTLGKIDQTRREIGQAINSRSGSFKDVETGLNKALYSKLAQDQEIIAKSAGLSEIAESAKALIIQRKGIEDNLVTILGRDLNQALSVNVGGAIKGLAKNDIGRFNKIINAIPKAQRAEIVMSAINDVFRGNGVGMQSLNPTQFVKWYQNINRSPAVKRALFGTLPKGSQKALDNLFKVSAGVSNALGNRVTTGRLNAMFNQETGFLRRMVGKTIPLAVGVATGSPRAAATTNATMEFLQQSTNGSRKAADLLASSEFQSIIRQSVKEGVIDGAKASAQLAKAEIKLKRTKVFEAWKNTLSATQQTTLKSNGLAAYLLTNELED